MQINLTDPAHFTLNAVCQLIASGDDNVHHQLRVSKDGIAYLSSAAVGGMDIEGLLFRLETWSAGSGCVGPIAASDSVWVMQIFNALKDNWAEPRFEYVDVY